jgi:hypothetical protein
MGEDGELRLTQTPQHESVTLAARAGLSAPVERHRLQPVGGDIFETAEPGQPDGGGQRLQFLGRDLEDHARFLFTGGRAIPRLGEVRTLEA